MYYYDDGEWKRKYAEFLSQKEVDYIFEIFNKALEELNLMPAKVW
jgi:hypothetical protein